MSIPYTPTTQHLVPAGATLQDELKEVGMSQKELSSRIGMSEKAISEIINGVASITADTAVKLESVLDVPAHIWTNLEGQYQVKLAKLKAEESLQDDLKILTQYSSAYRELYRYNYLPNTQDRRKRIESLRQFFGVTKLAFIPSLPQYTLYRSKTSGRTLDKYALSAWLRLGEVEASKQNVADFNRTVLRKKAEEISTLTNLDATEFSQRIQQLCAEAGVKVVYSPYFPKTYVNGAVRWFGNSPLLQLNLKGRFADIFWFTLMHELGHLLLHGKKGNFVEFDAGNRVVDELEQEADEFAQDSLIPKQKYEELVSNSELDRVKILAFAQENKIHPGIVAGRLANDDRVDFDYKMATSYRRQLQLA